MSERPLGNQNEEFEIAKNGQMRKSPIPPYLLKTVQSERNLAVSRTKRELKSVTVNEIDNDDRFQEVVKMILPAEGLFSKERFHGNIKWKPDHVVVQALIWSWQGCQNVTDAFVQTQSVCERIGLKQCAASYASFMGALNRYRSEFGGGLRKRYQELVEEFGGMLFRSWGWVLIAFDGSRVTAPRTVANETCVLRSQLRFWQGSPVWKEKVERASQKTEQRTSAGASRAASLVTLFWHMNLQLPWTWRRGPSNSSERGHVQEILDCESFPKKTLFCGDAGFVGYPLWNSILTRGADFLIRVGANVDLLSEQADYEKLKDGIVLCWPKGVMKTKRPPLRLRLVRVHVGKTKMWMLTNILDKQQLTKKQIVQCYKMRWGVEVEFRGLKQTLAKHKLRCRNDGRLLAERNWSIRGMAIAELLALREQRSWRLKHAKRTHPKRSLAKITRALRHCMRNLGSKQPPPDQLYHDLAKAVVDCYRNRTDKPARYRHKNPDIKPLGDPNVRSLNDIERQKLLDLKKKNAS